MTLPRDDVVKGYPRELANFASLAPLARRRGVEHTEPL